MKATARQGAAGAAGGLPLPAVKTKKKRKDGGGFFWGCGGSKSVCVAAGNLSSAAMKPLTKSSKPASEAKTTTAVAPVSFQDAEGAPSVDTLLRQLRELERGVRALGIRDREDSAYRSSQACRCSGRLPPPPRRRHRTGTSEVFGGSAYAAAGPGRGRLEEESVAVETETEDPLGEFRRSMAEMVAENGITGGAELRELLQRFLSLNSKRHHHLILLAFADVWEELFAGSRTGDGRPHASSKQKHLPSSSRSGELLAS
ncbi:transcription repressor OFP8-like [Lolium rigidum]|uniref:transcription repressor OFP8-like n=1 Tax=Lolium rigidum TaxID=89674 RepID=UPI001F5D471E|nr:transcription repressor OFP8-like [Lolium rigidum]